MCSVGMIKACLACLLLATLSGVGASKCSVQTSCGACTATTLLFVPCRWCGRDNMCHDPGAVVTNPCTAIENIATPSMCPCTTTPGPGVGPAACAWYEQTTSPGTPPAQWVGGDFLPDGYAAAATCACLGGAKGPGANSSTNPLWASPVAACVRAHILVAHGALSDTTKLQLQKYKNSYEIIPPGGVVDILYDLHVAAYSACGCPGTPAPSPAWYGVFIAGKALPCGNSGAACAAVPVCIISSILQFGRCGCYLPGSVPTGFLSAGW